MSSATEGRSDHPPGESGLTEWWNGVWTALGKKVTVGLMIFKASCGSRSRRASYLCVVRERVSGCVPPGPYPRHAGALSEARRVERYSTVRQLNPPNAASTQHISSKKMRPSWRHTARQLLVNIALPMPSQLLNPHLPAPGVAFH